MSQKTMTMRDTLIQRIHQRMQEDEKIVFIAADLGAPKLDLIRRDFKDRFINVGIAEQNLINVSVGFALEGYTVFSYAIAAFLSMRSYEQIRNNISLLSKSKQLNINLVAVGAGLSYDVSGPSHHCVEDIVIMRNLPNIMLLSPSDSISTEKMADYAFAVKKPKYLRLDGKPLPTIYKNSDEVNIRKGFCELTEGSELCFVATGIMTHHAIKAAEILSEAGIKVGVIDLFSLKLESNDALINTLDKYKSIITIEEGFIGKGGMDLLILSLMDGKNKRIERLGFGDSYLFNIGKRDYLHKISALDPQSIADKAKSILKKGI